MAVCVQAMAAAVMSFVALSRDPVAGEGDAVYLEAAIGMGDTLASGARGSPYRMRVERRKPNMVATIAWANVREELVAGDAGGLERRGSRNVRGIMRYEDYVCFHGCRLNKRTEVE